MTTFYTPAGNRRHAIKEQDATTLRSYCGQVVRQGQVLLSRVETNCARCRRWMVRDDRG